MTPEDRRRLTVDAIRRRPPLRRRRFAPTTHADRIADDEHRGWLRRVWAAVAAGESPPAPPPSR